MHIFFSKKNLCATPLYFFYFLIQKTFSSPRWRTQVRRAGEKMTYVQKTGKRKEKEKTHLLYGGHFSWKEKMFCLAIFCYLIYNKSFCCNLNKNVNKLLTMLKKC